MTRPTDDAVPFLLAREAVLLPYEKLPGQIFRDHLRHFAWMEYEQCLGDEFAALMLACSREAGGDHFFVELLDPFAMDNFGHSGRAQIRSAAEYCAFLDVHSPSSDEVMSIRNLGFHFLFTGPQATWAFLADRWTEVVVAARTDPPPWPVVEGVRFVPFDSMLKIAAGPYRGQLPEGKRDAFIKCYQAASWNPR